MFLIRFLILVFTLFSLNAFAQKRVIGEVYESAINRESNVAGGQEDLYKVLLTKTNSNIAKGKLIYSNTNPKFDFKISKYQLKKYSYLKFSRGKETAFFDLCTITKDSLKVFYKELEEAPVPVLLKKPAIYLYPTKETDVAVTLDFKGTLLTTYPAYMNGWNVIASKSGKLFNKFDRRSYNYLFWDGAYNFPKEHYNFTHGFYVPKLEYTQFLLSKLTQLGLNETEINDFIVFWLPQMNKYNYCFVHFNVNENIYNTAFINTNPPYDSQIRVFMEFKGFSNEITSAKPMLPQDLPSLKRFGFSLVEWGGSEVMMNLE